MTRSTRTTRTAGTSDDMVDLYLKNEDHYESGLTRIGCSEEQARAYGRLFETIRQVYWQAVRRTIAELGPGARVCDVGMGLGHDFEHFSRLHPEAHFTGVELSEATL